MERRQHWFSKVWRRRSAISAGWRMVLAAVALEFLLGALAFQSFGIYVAVWRTEFGWSVTAMAAAYSMQQGISGLAGPVHGWLLERYGTRQIVRIGIAVLGIGLVLLAQVDSLGALFGVLALMACGLSLGGFLSINTLVVNWISERRTTALAVVQVGMSVGGLVVPLMAWLISAVGWRTTAAWSGVLFLTAGLAIAHIMHDKTHADAGTNAQSRKSQVSLVNVGMSPDVNDDYSLRHALVTGSFWLLAIGHASALMLVSALNVHLVVFLVAERGLSLEAAAIVVAAITGSAIAGQLIGGLLGDRLSMRVAASAAMVGHMLAIVLLIHAISPSMLFSFAAFHGFAWGVRGPLMQSLRADYFGRSSFPTIMGVSHLLAMSGMIVGPLLVAVMRDYTGGYTAGLIGLSVVALVGAAAFLMAKKPSMPRVRSN